MFILVDKFNKFISHLASATITVMILSRQEMREKIPKKVQVKKIYIYIPNDKILIVL